MKIGQIAEILTMLVLGYVLKSLGWRTTMIFGVLGHGARFAVFAFYPEPWAAVAVNIVHGICYAFFFATVYIFVDEFFPKDARSSAQGLFNVLILGVGPLLGNFLGPWLGKIFQAGQHVRGEGKTHAIVDFGKLFLGPPGMALVTAILLSAF